MYFLPIRPTDKFCIYYNPIHVRLAIANSVAYHSLNNIILLCARRTAFYFLGSFLMELGSLGLFAKNVSEQHSFMMCYRKKK